jgi:hypothetical protein
MKRYAYSWNWDDHELVVARRVNGEWKVSAIYKFEVLDGRKEMIELNLLNARIIIPRSRVENIVPILVKGKITLDTEREIIKGEGGYIGKVLWQNYVDEMERFIYLNFAHYELMETFKRNVIFKIDDLPILLDFERGIAATIVPLYDEVESERDVMPLEVPLKEALNKPFHEILRERLVSKIEI